MILVPGAGGAGASLALAWEWEWQPSTTVGLVLIEAAYLMAWSGRGVRWPVPWRTPLPAGRLIAFTAGLAAIALLRMSPLETNDERLLWVHMVGHDLIIWIAAPLLDIGLLPLLAEAGRLPSVLRWPLIFAVRPPVALLGSTVLLWIWHLPAAYDLALRHDPIHALEHACFLVGFMVYWWLPIAGRAVPGGLRAVGTRAAYLVAGATQSAFLAAIIMFHGTVLYTPYLEQPGISVASVLKDQRLAGAFMLFPGVVVFAVAAALTLRAPPVSAAPRADA